MYHRKDLNESSTYEFSVCGSFIYQNIYKKYLYVNKDQPVIIHCIHFYNPYNIVSVFLRRKTLSNFVSCDYITMSNP